MRARGGDGVGEVVREGIPALAPAAHVNPGLRELVREERPGVEVGVARVRYALARPGEPGARRDGVCGRADGEELEDEVLAVGVPARGDEAGLWPPAVREQHGVAREHPAEVNALVDQRGESDDLRVFAEILPRREHAREQERRVNRGVFARPAPLARLLVHPVKEPAVLLRGALREEVKGREHAPPRVVARNPAARRADAKSREAEAGGGA